MISSAKFNYKSTLYACFLPCLMSNSINKMLHVIKARNSAELAIVLYFCYGNQNRTRRTQLSVPTGRLLLEDEEEPLHLLLQKKDKNKEGLLP